MLYGYTSYTLLYIWRKYSGCGRQTGTSANRKWALMMGGKIEGYCT